MNKKGFTLVELLAVLVILAIVALIAVPIILNVIDNAKKSSAVDSAYGYIEAIELNNALANVNEKYKQITDEDGLISINAKVKIKGIKPTEIYTKQITDKKVVLIEMCINGYRINYKNNKAKAQDKCENENNIKAQYVKYTPPADSESSVTTVKEALDELYNRIG